ncbi:MAG: type II CRISPR RNA-guided endonuclease Cas9, partial [Clostridia bacterium]|nr:type II CRISPR RNA-guided endonuclease Cas9 [Clostridia bacterium]
MERLKYSALFLDDKEKFGINNKFSLFNDSRFTDKEYFKKFATPYHLREHLLENPAEDIRFLYLAIHNIIKRRGHFLSEIGGAVDGDLTANINEAIKILKDMNFDNNFNLETISKTQADELCIELSEKKGKRQTKQGFEKILNAKTKTEKDFCSAMVDGVVNIAQFFLEKGAQKIDLNDEKAEENIFALEQSFGENAVNFLQRFSSIYLSLQLKLLLGENKYICQAMVEKFETHHNQLKDFKAFIKKYYPKEYFNLFRNHNNEKIGYSQYVNSDLYNGKKHVADLNIAVARDEEGFYDYVKKILEKEPSVLDEEFEKQKSLILFQIENYEFLPKIRSKANGALPNSLYRKELEQILKTSAEKFEFLNQKDESGLTNTQKILEILTFRVPYFVGPIGQNQSGQKHFWSKRIEGQEKADYKPWTLKKIVDFNQAEDDFIKRMTNKCTYLPTEDVLSKHSILYENFRVLNELNNLVINGKKISIELKQKIFNELFLKYPKVTAKRLKEFLVNENIVPKDEEIVISGIDGEFANARNTYLKFALTPNSIFTIDFVEENLEVFEEIVKLHTIMSDKERLIERLERRYPNIFSKEQLNYIKGLNFSGWGRLSKKFLVGLRFAKTDTGEVTTIMDELWQTNKNLQQIVTDGTYSLSETLSKEKNKTLQSLLYEDVNELYCSPAVKRGVWQAIQIVKEVALVMGEMPEKLFVEVTRHDEEKGDNGRKSSRQKQLQEKLAQIKNNALLTTEEYNKLQSELESKDNSQLRSESLYLYFLQCGKCAYTGTKLNIETLSKECDIDHIIPQALIKDDSIDNKVLVL